MTNVFLMDMFMVKCRVLYEAIR